jgi:hypothetical protein
MSVKPAANFSAAQRRHGLEVEDEGLLKDLVVIFIFFLDALIILFVVSFSARVCKKKNFSTDWCQITSLLILSRQKTNFLWPATAPSCR